MLIRHDPHLSRGRVLMPVPRSEWMPPSRAQQKTVFGHEDRTMFRLRACAHDGHVAWAGWFEDRDDADAFLQALVQGSLPYERELWRLPSVEWHPGVSTDLTFEFMAQTILTTTGSNQTYTSPQDWNNNNNTIRCLGGGASGGGTSGTSHATGGGGGAYSAITNFSFATPGTTTATYRVGAGGTAVSGAAGNNGEVSWFNDTVDPGSGTTNAKCSANGGTGGARNAGTANGGAGGTALGWGQTRYAGGRGGNFTQSSGSGGTGGGGAAGPSGAGGNGVDSGSFSTNITTAGGSANNGATAGGNGAVGGNGTEFSASYGCGSGGGGRVTGGSGYTGGNYGGGGGGNLGSNSGAGIQGLVIVEWTPVSLIFDPQPFLHILVR